MRDFDALERSWKRSSLNCEFGVTLLFDDILVTDIHTSYHIKCHHFRLEKELKWAESVCWESPGFGLFSVGQRGSRRTSPLIQWETGSEAAVSLPWPWRWPWGRCSRGSPDTPAWAAVPRSRWAGGSESPGGVSAGSCWGGCWAEGPEFLHWSAAPTPAEVFEETVMTDNRGAS